MKPKDPPVDYVANVYYDIAVRPLDYLKPMIYMMRFVEDQKEKLYSIFPTRGSIPNYIRIETDI